MTQTQRVLEYMRDHGSITEANAYAAIGCTRLSARIYDLKKAGHRIKTLTESGRNRFGERTTYARYTLEETG